MQKRNPNPTPLGSLNAAGIPIVRIDANKLPPTSDIKAMLENTILKIQS
jgi:hypothetical protein